MQTLAAILKRAHTNQTPGTWSAEGIECAICGFELDPEQGGTEHTCCICRDSGRVRRVKGEPGSDPRDYPGFGASAPCTCRLTGISEQEWLRRSGIPFELSGYTIEGWPGSKAIQGMAERYVSEWPPKPHVMLFDGAAGTGKSGLAVGVLRALWLRHHLIGRFVTAMDLLTRYRATFADEPMETTESVRLEYDRAPLIVLDDFGREGGTDFARREMFALINDRHHRGKPLIVTTNLSMTEIDPAIRSRLVDVERSVRCDFGTKDRRDPE